MFGVEGLGLWSLDFLVQAFGGLDLCCGAFGFGFPEEDWERELCSWVLGPPEGSNWVSNWGSHIENLAPKP